MKTLEMIKNLAERNTVVASADVLDVFAALEKSHQRIRELESQLQSGFLRKSERKMPSSA
ncbi:TPA: hypothetical protein ACGQS5_004815 [Serratia liquefaciens]